MLQSNLDLVTIAMYEMMSKSYRADAVALVDLLDDLTAVFEHLSSTIGLLTVQTPLMLPNGGTVAPPRSTGGGILVAVADYTAGLSEESQVERVATMALDLEAAAKAALREPLPRGKPLKMRWADLTDYIGKGMVGVLAEVQHLQDRDPHRSGGAGRGRAQVAQVLRVRTGLGTRSTAARARRHGRTHCGARGNYLSADVRV